MTIRFTQSKVVTESFKPMKDKIFATGIEEGMQKTKGGIILTDDNFKDHGIRPRWCQIWAVGEEVEDVKAGDWVLVEHGRWSLRIHLVLPDEELDIWQIDPKAMMIVTDTDPSNARYSA